MCISLRLSIRSSNTGVEVREKLNSWRMESKVDPLVEGERDESHEPEG